MRTGQPAGGGDPDGYIRRLEPIHLGWLREAVAAAPAEHCYLSQLLAVHGRNLTQAMTGTLYGYFRAGRLCSAYWLGGTIVPVRATPESNAAIAPVLAARRRAAVSIIGAAGAVLDLAGRTGWGEPRGVRPDQPLLAAIAAPDVAADARLRLARPADLPLVFPASVAMFEEELGFSPLEGGASGYRDRVAGLLAAGSTYVITEPDGSGGQRILFKADLGLRSPDSVQVQGVWVAPAARGHGVAAGAMAALTQDVLRRVAPVVSLYANSYNIPALKSYAHAGYRQVGTFATVMYRGGAGAERFAV